MAASLAWHRQVCRPQTVVQLTPPAQHVGGEAVIAVGVDGVGPGADDERLHVAFVDPAPDSEVTILAPVLSPAVGCHLNGKDRIVKCYHITFISFKSNFFNIVIVFNSQNAIIFVFNLTFSVPTQN